MRMILGVDIGGSTTKIVGCTQDGEIISSLQVKAEDAVTSAYGAVGKYLRENKRTLGDVERIILTGVGSAQIEGNIFQIPTTRVSEFLAIGLGGLALSRKTEAIIVSLGTGTAFVRASKDRITHLGGSGVGGGTLVGLCGRLANVSSIETITELASVGCLENVDLMIKDISSATVGDLPPDATASNFGKIRDTASSADITLGILNMIFQTVGVMALFATRNDTIRDIILTGTLSTMPQAKTIFTALERLYDLHYIIPENSIYATAVGAALSYFQEEA